MDIGARIKQLRRERGISQESLAERVGVSRQAVSKWEQGLSYPSTENLLALAQIFQVSADQLAGLVREVPPKRSRRWLWLLPLAGTALAACVLIFALRDRTPAPADRSESGSLSQPQVPEQEPDRNPEPADATQAVYIAWYALTGDQNLSAEETYRLRLELFDHLQFMDWSAYGVLGEAGQEAEIKMGLLAWLQEQETLSTPELTGLLAGGAGRSNLDGAYAECYADSLAQAFLNYPESFCRILSGPDFTGDERETVISLTCYGCYPEDVLQRALTAAQTAAHSGIDGVMEIARAMYDRLSES